MTEKSLKTRVLRGASFTVAGRLLRALQGVAVLGVLSRYLTAAEFGLISMVAFVAGIAQIFTDFGTRVALVQRRDVTRLQEDSVFWWNLGIGALLTAAIMVFSPQIAWLMGDDQIILPLLWMAPVFIIGALQGVPQSVLERRLTFGMITTAEVGGALVSSMVAVIMVMMGYKIEALVAQAIVAPFVTAMVIVLAAGWWPRFQFSYAELRPLLSYGGYVTAAGIVQFLTTRADRPIVGNRLSTTDLGYSRMAEQIVFSPLRITVQMVRKVMFPVMATIQDDDARMRRGYLTMQHGLMMVMAPVAFGLWAVASPAVRLILGPGWDMVAVLMGLMTMKSLFNTFSDLNNVIFSAKGWAKFQFYWSILAAILTVGALLVTVSYGIVAVVAGQLAVVAFLTPFNSYFALRLIGQSSLEVIDTLGRPILSALLMGLAVAEVQARLSHMSAGEQLLVCIPLGIVLYTAGEAIMDRKRFVPVLRQVTTKLRRR